MRKDGDALERTRATILEDRRLRKKQQEKVSCLDAFPRLHGSGDTKLGGIITASRTAATDTVALAGQLRVELPREAREVTADARRGRMSRRRLLWRERPVEEQRRRHRLSRLTA